MASSTSGSQAQDAQYLYDDRSVRYDDSHHPRFAAHMIELAALKPGEHVLDLACGTGLVTYIASIAVGPSGTVIGVDISSGMLAQAHAKLKNHQPENVKFFTHSITDLDSLDALKGKTFDVITCCSALVLLEHADDALKHWTTYLRPGGRLVVDAIPTQTMLSGIVLERVGKRLGVHIPYYRYWVESAQSLVDALKEAGLADVDIMTLALLNGASKDGKEGVDSYRYDPDKPRVLHVYNAYDADGVFEGTVDGKHAANLVGEGVREKAKAVFREEWEKLADEDGKVVELDCSYVGIGRKP